jgi:hypothetical protein
MTQSSFTPQAKKKSLGYSTDIDTVRDSSVNGFTAFGTSDEFDDPIDIIENDSDGSNSGIGDFDATTADDGASDSDDVSDDGETDIEGVCSGSDTPDVSDQSTETSDTVDVSDWRDAKKSGKMKGRLRASDEPISLEKLQSKLQWDRDEVVSCVSQLQSRKEVRDTGDGYVLMD